ESGYRAVLWKQNEGTDSMKQDLQRRIMMDLESGDPVFLSINMKVAYESQNDLVHEVVLYGSEFFSTRSAIWGSKKVYAR
ncbi:hypothetical protein, partial [Dubosiella newyorkensis]